MTQAQKLNTISSTRVFMRGCVFALFVAAQLAALPCPVKADMLLFWNFDEYTTVDGVNYVTDSVHSERLKLVNSSIVDGQLSANGGYAQGTGTNNGTTTALPTGSASYTLSAFLTSTTNATVGIMGWGAKSGGKCNCFRTTGNSGETTGGLNSYWWGNDVVVSGGGYPEIYGGVENHVATTAVGNTHYLYLNGQLLLSDTKGARSEENRDFAVGKTVNNEQLKGSLDNASIYNEALEQSDIITISTSKLNGLTNWWKSGTTVDRISGIVKPGTVTGTTVITGANGDVMVFNRALEAGEQTFYQGQLAAGHDYVINNMAGSESTKTTWLRASSANLSDAAQTPLGIYVGGTTTEATLTATADQLNSVNRTLVLGGGTLAIASDSDVSIDKNRVGFDSGSISTSGNGTITLNSSEILSLKAINVGTNSALALKTSDDTRILGATSLGDNSSLTVNTVDLQILGATAIGANSSVNLTASGSTQMNSAVSIGADSSLNIESSGNTRIGGVISGAGNLNKSGTGTLTLAAANTFNGDFTITAGTVEMAKNCNSTEKTATPLGDPSNADRKITVKSGATLVTASGSSGIDVFGGANAYPKFTLVADGGTIATSSNNLTTYGDIELKNGGVFEDRGGHIDNANQPNKNWYTVFNGDVYVTSGNASIQANSNGKGISIRGYRNGAAAGVKFDVAEGATLTSSAVLMDCLKTGEAGSFTKTGKGKLTLAAANTFSGDITINEGTVELAKNCNSTETTATPLGNPALAGRKITVKSGAILVTANGGNGIDVFGGANAHPKFTLVADGGTIATATDNLTTYGDIELKNNAVFDERGGHSTWYTIFNGDISVTSGNATIKSTNGKGISLRGYRNGTNAGVTFDVAKNSTLTVSALLKDSPNSHTVGSFTKKGEGTMILSNRSNDFTGNIVVDEGILKAQGGWAGGTSGTTVLGKNQARTITINKDGTLNFTAQDVVTNADNSTSIKFVVKGGTITNEGAVFNNLVNTEFYNGAKLVAANGNGTWKAFMLSGTNKVAFAGDGSTAETPVVFEVASTATGAALTNATICPYGATFEVADITKSDASDLVISAVLANTNGTGKIGSFTKTGAGTMELSAANTYTGATTINAGTLKLTGDGTLGTGVVTIGNDGTLEFKDSTATISNAISGAGDILVSSGTANLTGAVAQTGGSTILADGTTLNLGSAATAVNPTLNNLAVTDEDSSATLKVYGDLTLNNDQMSKFIGSITAETIEKTGDGTLKIYTGAAGQVDAQSLVVSSGRLDLKGYMTKTITVNANAVFSPGNSVGEATYGGNYILDEGATMLFEIGGETVDKNDSLYNKDNAADEGKLLINGLIILTLADDSTLKGGDTFTAILSGSNSGDEGFAEDLLSHVQSYYFTDLRYVPLGDGNYAITGVLDPNAVPEPSTWALLALGVCGLLYLRKRK